jgi:xanthine phosphoribosyltransferase
MTYYSYAQFVDDVKRLVAMTRTYNPDTVVAIARGGVSLGHAYASATNIRQLMSINSILYEGDQRGKQCEIFNIPDLSRSKTVLLIDDIIDSGQTIKEVMEHITSQYPEIELRIASLFYKKTAVIQADFSLHEATDWIEFFWEKDFLEDTHET